MTALPTDEAVENYKGQFIQYCQERGLGQPVYTETQHGPADAPSWHVTVRYGDSTHETPVPVPGSKKWAHQVASKQILAEIASRREQFLAGEVTEQPPAEPASAVAEASVAEASVAEASVAEASAPIEVPIDIVSSALTIANERLTASQPTRYRTLSDAEFSKKLAQLTCRIIRDLVKKAEQDELTFK